MDLEALRKKVEYQVKSGQSFPLEEAVEAIKSEPEDQRWEIMRREYHRAAEMASWGIPSLFLLVDQTKAGGAHLVRALLHPVFEMVMVEIPEENQSGKFPTVLHALEVADTVARPSHPRAKFLHHSELFDQVVGQIRGFNVAFIPLIVDPARTNCVIFNKQARPLDPETVAQKYHQLLAHMDLTTDLMRHTMLVIPQSDFQHAYVDKNELAVEIWPHREIGRYFNLIHPGRIGSWDTNERKVPIHRAILREPNPKGEKREPPFL